MAVSRKLTVNGDSYTVAVEPSETLLDVLREKLRLTGTKKGCNVGDCGACTVLVDGEAMNSCLLLASEMEGKAITTIEGLAKDGELAPLQKAFVHEGGIQCGFCTPGMVMSATALLYKNSKVTTDEIKEALSGNLCRCTGYTGILRAVQRCTEYRDDCTHPEKETEQDNGRAAAFSPRGAPHDAFARTLLWFVTFMVHEDAPAGTLDALLGRLAPLGIETAAERRRMLDEARRWAGKL